MGAPTVLGLSLPVALPLTAATESHRALVSLPLLVSASPTTTRPRPTASVVRLTNRKLGESPRGCRLPFGPRQRRTD